MRLALLVAATVLCVAPLGATLGAQRDQPQLQITLPAVPGEEGPAVVTANLLADPNTRELLRNGFPARVHFRLELWRKGGWIFDDLAGRAQWDVVVHYDPTTQLFYVIRQQDNNVLENFGGFSTVTTAEAEFDKPFRSALHPSRSGHYYYYLFVDVQTLTESDLDALQQWWHGPSAPGHANPVTSLRNGIGTLLSRMLGGDKRHYEAKSDGFAVP